MAKTLWTPGPWEFYDADESPNGKAGVFTRYYSDEDVGICGDQSTTWPLAEKDAHLLAAAPDLYAALDAMTAAFKRRAPLDTAVANMLLLMCESALARARGQEVAP